MNSKNELLNNFEFKIVEMEVFSTSNKDGRNNLINYSLLVADNGIIVDYKIKFEKIAIKDKTTPSHRNDIESKSRLKYREDILNKLKIFHEFSSEKRNVSFYNSKEHPEVINFINKYVESVEFSRNITFQNIEYILNGSNPSGQGKTGKGFLKTKHNGNDVVFGIFLGSINNVKNFYKYCEKNFDDFSNFDEFYNDESIERITFDEWLNKTKLKKFFNRLKENHSNWKIIKKEIKESNREIVKKFNDINKVVSNLRRLQKNNLDNKFKKIYNNFDKKKIYEYYFGKNEKDHSFEYAHIKPVYLIKHEYYKKHENYSILEEISDPNNFLPLTPDAHWSFDKKEISWKNNGELITKNEKLLNKFSDFIQINEIALNDIKKYLIEYNTKVFNKV